MLFRRRASHLLVSLCFAGAVVAAHADTCTSSANLITNCGFEGGASAAGSNVPAGWTVSQWTGEEQIATDHVNSGSYSMRIANDAGQGGPEFNGAAILSQNFNDTANDLLTFSFYLFDGAPNDATPTDELFQAFYDSTSAAPVFATNGIGLGTGFEQFSFSVVGTGSDSITFTSYNNPSWFWLDDVSVTDAGAVSTPPVGTGVTPEPSTLSLLGTGVLGLVGMGRRRMRRTV